MSLFPPAPEQHRFRKFIRAPRAKVELAIHFTPRSGSSRLTELLGQTGRLGRAAETFNPTFLPNIAERLQAPDLDSYAEVVRRHLAEGQVFSFEITSHQMMRVFGRAERFHELFGNARDIWLIRRDIVLQAVSLAKMVTVGMGHSVQADFDHTRGMEYDAALIEQWLNHIRIAEEQSEAYFADYNRKPWRICYEDTVTLPPDLLVRRIAQFAGVWVPSNLGLAPTHEKIGSAENEAHAERFRHDRAATVRKVEAARRRYLDLIEPL